MRHLPVELYREILQYVSLKRDLCTLSVTSRALQVEAEYFLYHSIQSTCLPETLSICNAIILCPRLGPIVRSITLETVDRTTPFTSAEWRTVAQAMEKLSDLESLTISNLSTKTRAWIFDRCTFSLKELKCDFAPNDAFIAFLWRQHALRTFNWMFNTAIIDPTNCLPPDPEFLPSLRQMAVNMPSLAYEMMIAHPLTHLWIMGPFSGEEISAYTADSNGFIKPCLRSLRLSLPYDQRESVPLLAAISVLAPELRSLEFLPPFTAQDSELITTISSFKRLESLSTSNAITAETAFVLAQACQSLRQVACLHYSYTHEYVFLPVNPMGFPRPVHDPKFRLWRDV